MKKVISSFQFIAKVTSWVIVQFSCAVKLDCKEHPWNLKKCSLYPCVRNIQINLNTKYTFGDLNSDSYFRVLRISDFVISTFYCKQIFICNDDVMN